MVAEESLDAPVLVAQLGRSHRGKLVCALASLLGPRHLDLADEAVQDAFVAAISTWPSRGVPERPTSWLLTVAKNRATDHIRRRARHDEREEAVKEALVGDQRTGTPEALAGEIPDERLAMLFLCCHPRLSPPSQLALMLKTVCGLDVDEVARAFLVERKTLEQRLVRAKRQLQQTNDLVEVPAGAALEPRLAAVQHALYLLFSSGSAAFSGDALVRPRLVAEALELGALLAAHAHTSAPTTLALLALMHLEAARLPARLDAGGELVLLADQDRSLWDRGLMASGAALLERSLSGEDQSSYHLEALIAAQHTLSPRFSDTDWKTIRKLYDQLLLLEGSPVVRLNRAVAVGFSEGPSAALPLLDELEAEGALKEHFLLDATRARMLSDAGQLAAAKQAYGRALTRAQTTPERRFLTARLAAM